MSFDSDFAGDWQQYWPADTYQQVIGGDRSTRLAVINANLDHSHQLEAIPNAEYKPTLPRFYPFDQGNDVKHFGADGQLLPIAAYSFVIEQQKLLIDNKIGLPLLGSPLAIGSIDVFYHGANSWAAVIYNVDMLSYNGVGFVQMLHFDMDGGSVEQQLIPLKMGWWPYYHYITLTVSPLLMLVKFVLIETNDKLAWGVFVDEVLLFNTLACWLVAIGFSRRKLKSLHLPKRQVYCWWLITILTGICGSLALWATYRPTTIKSSA
jgi:hypothetical protein